MLLDSPVRRIHLGWRVQPLKGGKRYRYYVCRNVQPANERSNGKHPDRTVEPGNVPRISRLMALAIRFDGLVRRGEVGAYADLYYLLTLLHQREYVGRIETRSGVPLGRRFRFSGPWIQQPHPSLREDVPCSCRPPLRRTGANGWP